MVPSKLFLVSVNNSCGGKWFSTRDRTKAFALAEAKPGAKVIELAIPNLTPIQNDATLLIRARVIYENEILPLTTAV